MTSDQRPLLGPRAMALLGASVAWPGAIKAAAEAEAKTARESLAAVDVARLFHVPEYLITGGRRPHRRIPLRAIRHRP